MRTRLSVTILIAVSTTVAWGGPAQARQAVAPAIARETAPAPERDPVWQAAAGVRAALIKGEGFDPFSTEDALSQLTVGVSRRLVRRGPLALAAGVTWDTGESDATARGATTRLDVDRLALTADLQYRPLSRLHVFGRLAPGVLRATASLTDASASWSLQTHRSAFTTFSVDASVGAAGRITGPRARAGVWIVAEAGYSWSAAQAMSLTPDLSADDRASVAAVPLKSLAIRGVFGRASLALTF